MKLVNTTGILEAYYEDKSVAAPIAGMVNTGFKHLDLSMYCVLKGDTPWTKPGDSWKKEIEDCLAYRDRFDFCQAHSPDGQHFVEGENRDRLILATKRSIEACAMLGIPHTVMHAAAVRGGTPTEFIKKNVEFYKLFEEDCEKFGVDILIENSSSVWYPGYYLLTGREMREFIEMANMPRLHICWDIGHGNAQGRDQYSDIIAMGDELHALHVQDNFGTADSHISPMMGTTNFDRVMQALVEIGYQGDFTFEDGNTLRRNDAWPHFRRDPKETDKLQKVPLSIMQKQMSVTYDIGKWMLESYGIQAD